MYYVCCVVGGYCKGKPGMNHAQRMRLCNGYGGDMPDYPGTVTVTDPATGQTAVCTFDPQAGQNMAFDPVTGKFHP